MRHAKPQVTLGRYSLTGVFVTVAIARRPRRLSEVMKFLAAARQVAVNPPGSGFDGPGHGSCEIRCREKAMTTQTANRRESDRVPMGVESALPWVPVPSSSSEQPPKAKTGALRRLVLAIAALAVRKGSRNA